jgi:hypothetical protein
MSSSAPHEHHHMLWQSDGLRCVLITRKDSLTCEVYVFNGDSPVSMERCTDADEAATIAERLWDRFVDNG